MSASPGIRRQFGPPTSMLRCELETSSEIEDASEQTHKDTAKRPYPCPIPGCKQRFKRSFTLKDHVNAHVGERPFVCPVQSCRRSFVTSGNLARHKRIHPWLTRPLPCLVAGCGCEFVNEAKLERHMKTHFGEVSGHHCSFPSCGKMFSTRGNLRRHIGQSHHPRRAAGLSPLTMAPTLNTPTHWTPAIFTEPLGVPKGALSLPCAVNTGPGSIHELSRDYDVYDGLAFLFENQEAVQV